MLVLLPLISFISLFLCFVGRGLKIRVSFLSASILHGLLLVISTEFLSVLHLIDYSSLAAFWGLITLSSLVCCRSFFSNFKPFKSGLTSVPPFTKYVLAAVAVIVGTTLLIAVICPPTTYDAMTYHMSRVMHWIQNSSVAHYPTHITRQLYSPPWAEFAIMHLQILSGGDRLANLVQWFSMLGCLFGVSLIAEEFCASQPVQVLAVLVTSSIPMGILQSSSTQNDYAVSYWLVCFVYFGVVSHYKPNWYHTIGLGSSLGLAILTKGTAYLFALPFLLWFAVNGIRNLRAKALWHAVVISILVMGINSGHYHRNFELWGNPITTDTDRLKNEEFGLVATVSNISRNVILHTRTPIPSVNVFVDTNVRRLHKILNADMNDKSTTLSTFLIDNDDNTNEAVAGNPLHFVLILFGLPLLLIPRKRVEKPVLLYSLSLIFGALLYCFALKWQPWGSRLQLPLFVLSSPLIALTLSLLKQKIVINTIVFLLLAEAMPALIFNSTKPIFDTQYCTSIFTTSSIEMRFRERPDYYELCRLLLRNPSGYNNLGLIMGYDDPEYLIWAFIKSYGLKMPRIENVNVRNRSGAIPIKDFTSPPILEIKGPYYRMIDGTNL